MNPSDPPAPLVSTGRLFRRPELATRLAGLVLSPSPTTAVASGLFLAAPRRTGKSTFLRDELRPALAALGAVVLYVDLWADRRADPGEVIVGAVRAALADRAAALLRLARTVGLARVRTGVADFDLARIGLGKGVTLSAALAALSDEVAQPIVLIVDEAQHALTTPAGYDALFALKAARDELNSAPHHGLRVVATGSNRDKLAVLRNSRDHAFFGAPLQPFPALDRGYIDWFCTHAELPGPLDPDAVAGLFQRAGARPEILNAAADAVRLDLAVGAAAVPAAFAAAVEREIAAAREQQLQVVHGLTPVQSAVLRVLAARGRDYAPFELATIEQYRAVLARIAPDETRKLDVPTVQAALAALQDKQLVWKEQHGIYSLEEESLAAVMGEAGLLAPVPPPAA